MIPYTFFKQGRADEIPPFDIGAFPDDQEACAYARDLLSQNPQWESVLVVREDGVTYGISRNPPGLTSGRPRSGDGADCEMGTPSK